MARGRSVPVNVGLVMAAESPKAVSKPLRVLLVEDSEVDASLVAHALARGGYTPICVRVQSQEEFKAALNEQPWDVILSDHSLPGYSGLRALADSRATGKDIPFILVSGTIGEDIAVEAMRSGAQDYVHKADLTRLPAAVAREVHEAAGRAEQEKMREQLMLSERMAAAGTLAAGVAHEINNPLAVAMANLDFAAAMLGRLGNAVRTVDGAAGLAGVVGDCLGEVEEPIRDMREALQRIRDIVRDVKLFSRAGDDLKSALDVRRIIDSSCRMARNEIRHRARLEKDYGDVPLVFANESRIGQVILNLIVNAAQSMPEGHAEDNVIRVRTRTWDDGRAAVEVIDTGSGIAPHDLPRIFDPFFTTKAVGEGTGLGLAISRRIVTELGGQIEVESEIGKGTAFRVLFPAAHAMTMTSTLRSSPPIPPARSMILVVDDEAAVGRALKRGLSAHHDVFVVTSGSAALAHIADGERFDVILSDLMMPDVSGMDLHRQLRTLAPDQAERMIFLSGGAFTSAAREFLDRVPNPRVEKPLELTNVLAIIAGFARRDINHGG
jgi:signal transduction histidine kinase